jgi:hypothetical protein
MTTPRQKANDKWNKKAYRNFNMRLKPELYDEVEHLRQDLKLSKPELIKLLIQTFNGQSK